MTLILYWSLPALLFFSFGIFAIPNVWAITINVDGSCTDTDIVTAICDDNLTYRTIYGAIDAAMSGNTINVAAGTYSITSDLTIDKKIILQGSGNGGDPLVDTIIELAPPSSTLIDITAGGPSMVDRQPLPSRLPTDRTRT